MFQILIGWLVAYLLTNGAATKQLPKLKIHATCSNLFHTNLDLNSYFVASYTCNYDLRFQMEVYK